MTLFSKCLYSARAPPLRSAPMQGTCAHMPQDSSEAPHTHTHTRANRQKRHRHGSWYTHGSWLMRLMSQGHLHLHTHTHASGHWRGKRASGQREARPRDEREEDRGTKTKRQEARRPRDERHMPPPHTQDTTPSRHTLTSAPRPFAILRARKRMLPQRVTQTHAASAGAPNGKRFLRKAGSPSVSGCARGSKMHACMRVMASSSTASKPGSNRGGKWLRAPRLLPPAQLLLCEWRRGTKRARDLQRPCRAVPGMPTKPAAVFHAPCHACPLLAHQTSDATVLVTFDCHMWRQQTGQVTRQHDRAKKKQGKEEAGAAGALRASC